MNTYSEERIADQGDRKSMIGIKGFAEDASRLQDGMGTCTTFGADWSVDVGAHIILNGSVLTAI